MCERAGELKCPFLAKDEKDWYFCELPDNAGDLGKDYLHKYCLMPHCRKCHHYQAFEEANFPLFNPRNRKP